MIVWVTVEYSATVESKVARPVCCEKCQTEYVYWQKLESEARERSPFGLGGRPDFSRELNADQRWQRKYSFEEVPCPDCFHFPDYMARAAYRGKCMVPVGCGFGSLLVTLVAAGIAGVIWVAYGLECFGIGLWVVAGLFALVGVPLAVIGVVTAATFDSNAKKRLPERRRLAEERGATRREEFEGDFLADAERDLRNELAYARRRPHDRLRPVEVHVWHGFVRNEPKEDRELKLPTGEVYRFDIPDDAREFDAFDLKRDVDGERVTFRCVLRRYHPTRVPRSR